MIGGLHGNEPVTPPAVRGLLQAAIAPDVEVWLVPVANPDGSAAGLRCNANGVDLNRNFPWDWRPSDGGPAPLSEPETQALVTLVEQQHPDVVIWVHQPLGYVEVRVVGSQVEVESPVPVVVVHEDGTEIELAAGQGRATIR